MAIVVEKSRGDSVLPDDLWGYFQDQGDLLAPLGALNAHHPPSLQGSIRVARACVKMAEHLGFDEGKKGGKKSSGDQLYRTFPILTSEGERRY